jgi:hypothetical protein
MPQNRRGLRGWTGSVGSGRESWQFILELDEFDFVGCRSAGRGSASSLVVLIRLVYIWWRARSMGKCSLSSGMGETVEIRRIERMRGLNMVV